ncbi:endonuclease/exonuclease/phosphatase family protein [Pseudoalteromonas lipolytica]|uniref:endonuclease/exonuclease/phosphatase family protein n=1 Tax=Pseudoalteromonas lipolytica TaxID=570156 RepID=UPI0024202C38|nr:endonuclease/exonuclease/phosphatase family protein [Pseudoalteromonas lipolytica]
MPHTHTLKFASLNLLNYTAPPYSFYQQHERYNNTQWQQKQQFVRDFLFDSKADVVAFQEVFSAHALEIQCKEAGYDYFETVDCPSHDALYPQVLFNPIVAIASKYPFICVEPLTPCPELLEYLNNQSDFKFNRTPIKCFLNFPEFGEVCCYVVHFKSKRSLLNSVEDNSKTEEQNLLLQLKDQVAGRWASSIQRGSEAALLLIEIINRRSQTDNPVIVMGDFNNELHDGVLNHLITDSLRFTASRHSKAFTAKYALQDSWQLYQRHVVTDNEREATHYFGSSSSVFDYILLSREFDAGFQGSFYEVIDYHTYDQHLINPQFAYDDQSTDHGVVMVTLALRS